MATKTETRIAVIEETPAGDRARLTVPVPADGPTEEFAARLDARVRHIAASTDNPLRCDTFTHTVSR